MTQQLRSNWLDLTLALLVVIAEVAMVAPWLFLLAGLAGNAGADIPSPLGLAFVGLFSYWSTRYFLTGGWDLSAARAMSVVAWLVLMIIWFGVNFGYTVSAPWHFLDRLVAVDTPVVVMVIVGAVAWWRAISIASDPRAFTPEFTRRLIWRSVLASGAALILSWVIGGVTSTRVGDSAAIAFPLMLVASLLAAGAAQARTARAEIKSGADPVRVGLGTASGVTLGLILLAVGVAGLAGRHFWSQAAGPLRAVEHVIGTVLSVVIYAVAFVLFLLLWPFFWLAHLLVGNHIPPPPQAQQQAGSAKEITQNANDALPHFVTVTLELLLLAVIVGVVFWFILRSMRRFRTELDDERVDEIHESVWSSDLAMSQLRSLLQGLGGRRPGTGRKSVFDLNAEPADVRDAYRHLLVLANQQGQGRAATESASDYLNRLRVAWSNAGEPLDDLTLRYLAARYAEQSSAEDLLRARQDWQSLRSRFGRG